MHHQNEVNELTENHEIFTIGHSTHSKDFFIKMLKYAEIETLVDVRAFPGSRKYPHFKKENMQNWLLENGIEYIHLSDLGGRRGTSGDVGLNLNDGWRNDSFHNYADYTLTDEFKLGIADLMELARKKRTAYFCSERHPARCHRLIISNYLQAHQFEVKHIIDQSKDKIDLVPHQLGQWGAMPIIEDDGEVVYPKLND